MISLRKSLIGQAYRQILYQKANITIKGGNNLQKIKFNELKDVVKKFKFDVKYYNNNVGKKFIEVYHIHEWDHGYDSIYYCINSDGSVRNTFKNTRRQFYSDMKEMIHFLCDYINYNHITNLITAPLFLNSWISCESYSEVKDIYSEIVLFLKKSQIRKNSKNGAKFEISENIKNLEMLVEGAFRGVSNACFLFQQNNVVIEPSHHFNFIFYPNDFEKEKKVITALLKKHSNLQYYESSLK